MMNRGKSRGHGDFSRGTGGRSDPRKPFRHCDYCNIDGHVKETCFRLHGYPDWYKDYNARTYVANMANTPLTIDSAPQSFHNQCHEPSPSHTPAVFVKWLILLIFISLQVNNLYLHPSLLQVWVLWILGHEL